MDRRMVLVLALVTAEANAGHGTPMSATKAVVAGGYDHHRDGGNGGSGLIVRFASVDHNDWSVATWFNASSKDRRNGIQQWWKCEHRRMGSSVLVHH